MRRHCDGKDPNLVMYVDQETNVRCGDNVNEPQAVSAIQKPCDCGRVFDDVRRSTVYPHEPI